MTQKQFDDLDFTDNFMFCKVMTRKPELAKKVIELVLGESVAAIQIKQAEKDIHVLPDQKGIRLDVYVRTADGRVIDVEMQTRLYPYLPRRMRYYQAIEDVNLLTKGYDYDDLPENIIIFIVLKDPYNRGYYRYTFENRCEEDTDLLFGDDTKKIYINASGDASSAPEEMKHFLRFLKGGMAMSDLTRELEDAVDEVKNNRAIRIEYMSMCAHETDIRREGREEGREELLMDLVHSGDIALQLAAEKLRIPPEEARRRYNAYVSEGAVNT